MNLTELKISDRLSHAYIVSSSSPQEGLQAAGLLACAAVCTADEGRPCMKCRDCRKVAGGIHPDVTEIGRLTDPKGVLKKEISVTQIRELSADAIIAPNEAHAKVYIIKEADLMNSNAQNAALKLFEDPPKNVVFILCVTNAERMLATVRSRCTELIISAGEVSVDSKTSKRVDAYLESVCSGRKSLIAFCMAAETMSPAEALSFVDALEAAIVDVLAARRGPRELTAEQCFAIHELTVRCRDYLTVNTGVKQIIGLLMVLSPLSSGNRGNTIDRSSQY